MSTGGVFKLITNDGKMDRLLMDTRGLNKRLYNIENFGGFMSTNAWFFLILLIVVITAVIYFYSKNEKNDYSAVSGDD